MRNFFSKIFPHVCTRVLHRLLLPVILFAQPAAAHDFWIEPDSFSASQGAPLNIRLREGVGFKGDTLPFIRQWFVDFTTVTAAGREPVFSLQGDDPAAVLEMSDGPLLIGYQSFPNLTTLDAAKFNRYLEEEGIEYIREQRIARGEDDAPAPEYFVRCAKALAQGPDSDGEEDIYARALGYTLELIPEQNPYAMAVGDDLTFRLLLRGEPAAGLLVQAFTQAQPESIQKIRVGDDGLATVRLDASGVWLIKAVNIEPETRSPDADWLSHWASFVFELR